MYAISNKYIDIIRLLLIMKADISLFDNLGRNAISIARQCLNEDIISLLQNVSLITTNKKCTICFVNIRNVLFRPCRHLCVCQSCRIDLFQRGSIECPVCKTPIESFDTIYIP